MTKFAISPILYKDIKIAILELRIAEFQLEECKKQVYKTLIDAQLDPNKNYKLCPNSMIEEIISNS